jgi:probable rRNA maturation factor
MMMRLTVRNDSLRKGLYRTEDLLGLARRVCAGEGFERDAELSLLFCDDPFIMDLNRRYRGVNRPTDVLSFGQEPGRVPVVEHPSVLGDIVISLETVEHYCAGARAVMRDEIRLLFCHGLLHLLGLRHDTETGRRRMMAKQAAYLAVNPEAAWRTRPPLTDITHHRRHPR